MSMLIKVNGESLMLDSSGALWWPDKSTLVFSDLHFEKGSSFARWGQFLPPYDTRTTLARMRDVIDRLAPNQIVALGDTFHDKDAASRLGAEDRDTLTAMARATDWIWIAGNHDPLLPLWVPGQVSSEYNSGGLVFRHEPLPLAPAGEVAGHLHPCATVRKWGRAVRRRCFVSDGTRLVLPSFGAFTGGLDVRDEAVRGLFGADFWTYLLGSERVYAIPG